MRDESLLIDYQHFVDAVTSDESKDPDAFGDALDVIDDFGVPPERLITAAMGLSAESGEFQGKPMDEHTTWHAKRELGDICWYLVQACIALDTNLEEVIYMNTEKLESRYPDGFDSFRSENREEGDL